jgi:hypothetical protein
VCARPSRKALACALRTTQRLQLDSFAKRDGRDHDRQAARQAPRPGGAGLVHSNKSAILLNLTRAEVIGTPTRMVSVVYRKHVPAAVHSHKSAANGPAGLVICEHRPFAVPEGDLGLRRVERGEFRVARHVTVTESHEADVVAFE